MRQVVKFNCSSIGYSATNVAGFIIIIILFYTGIFYVPDASQSYNEFLPKYHPIIVAYQCWLSSGWKSHFNNIWLVYYS